MNMIVYTECKTGEHYYDTTMLQAILRISKSKLKMEMLLFGFQEDEYLTYNNRYLIKEEAVIMFIDYMAEKYLKRQITTYKRLIKNKKRDGV